MVLKVQYPHRDCACEARGPSPLGRRWEQSDCAVEGLALLTRDVAGYRTYFPTVRLTAPPS